MLDSVGHFHLRQQLLGAGKAFGTRHTGIEQRQLDIGNRACAWNKIESLKHKADFAVTNLRKPVVRHITHGYTVEKIAALGGAVKGTDDVHQCRFSRAGCADY
ncbi:hypothetical protein SDC9_133948 [bioreactor metagenome]|uniref:Uncharacterized protein n=1 Tax=bioreactor metagenome TaxID=1076179 RepID=A0A645DBN3_9ZZZZ